jgi:hypothetical protein
MKKYLAIFTAICAFAGAPAFAQAAQPALDPATVSAVKQMMSAMKIRELMRASMQQMEQVMPMQLRQTITASINSSTTMSPEQKQHALAKMEASLPKMVAALHETIADPSLMDEMATELVAVYARNYTTAEIQQLAAFYQSPLGQKMLATMPKVMAESMQVSNKIMAPRMEKLMAATRKSLED